MLLAHCPILGPLILLYGIIVIAVAVVVIAVNVFASRRVCRLVGKVCLWIFIAYSAFFWLMILLYNLYMK